MIRNYNDFVETLLNAGFSLGGGGDDGIYSVVTWGWQEEPPYDTPVRWHTDDPDTDPWEWRMRVLDERDDIAYAKLLFKKSGFITKKWYPYFLATRRSGRSFIEAYESGNISHFAKRIYEVVASAEVLPSQEIKRLAGFTKEEKSNFDRALVELQMMMFITVSGRQLKPTNSAWSSVMFSTTERFFGEAVFIEAESINANTAEEKITEQILKLNPSAQEKKIRKFIYG